jgi:hypothetical protein
LREQSPTAFLRSLMKRVTASRTIV